MPRRFDLGAPTTNVAPMRQMDSGHEWTESAIGAVATTSSAAAAVAAESKVFPVTTPADLSWVDITDIWHDDVEATPELRIDSDADDIGASGTATVPQSQFYGANTGPETDGVGLGSPPCEPEARESNPGGSDIAAIAVSLGRPTATGDTDAVDKETRVAAALQTAQPVAEIENRFPNDGSFMER